MVNVYRPGGIGGSPDDKRTDDFDPEDLPTDDQTIIAGDFNVHHATWDAAATQDPQGVLLHRWMLLNGMIAWNDPEVPTRIGHGTRSSPDIVISHSSWDGCTWKTLDSLGSDHLPIELCLPFGGAPKEMSEATKHVRVRWCWSRADWKGYAAEMESRAPQAEAWKNPYEAYHCFKGLLNNVALKHIPQQRRRPNRKRWFNARVKRAIAARNEETRRQQAEPPTAKDAQKDALHLQRLRQEATVEVAAAKRVQWEKRCEAAGVNPSAAYTLIRELDGRSIKDANFPLVRDGKPVTAPMEKADMLAAHFAGVSGGGTKLDPNATQSLRTAPSASDNQAELHPSEQPFTMEELRVALAALGKRKAPGPDEIPNEFLLNLGPRARAAFLGILNLSWCTGVLPDAWTRATLVPIHKPKRPATKPESYRPIALTSTSCKVLERMIKARLVQLMEDDTLPCAQHHPVQAGFRKLRSTEDQLAHIVQLVQEPPDETEQTGPYSIRIIPKPQRKPRVSVVLFVDMQQAFDRVKRDIVLRRIEEMGFPRRYRTWLTAFLTNRRARVSVEGATSGLYEMKEGVPQGTVLSPLLFNIVMDEMAELLAGLGHDVRPAIYADDIAIVVSGSNIEQVAAKAQQALELLCAEGPTRGLEISREKTEHTVFGKRGALREVAEGPLLAYPDGTPVKRTTTPRYLGVTLDPTCSMQYHHERVIDKLLQRLNVVKMLAGSSWGCNAHTLRTAYLTYALPAVSYALGVYGPLLSNTMRAELERLHHQAARFITGCPTSTRTEDLLWEAHLDTFSAILDTAVATTYERFRRLDGTPGNAVTTLVGPKYSWLHQARCTSAECGLSGETMPKREAAPLHVATPTHPWEWNAIAEHIDIRTSLPGIIASRTKYSNDSLFISAQMMLRDLPDCAWHAYTDGCVSDGRGAGAVVIYRGDTPNAPHLESSHEAGRIASSFQAELLALVRAMEALTTLVSPGDHCAVITDSMSVLQALQTGPHRAREDLEHKLWQTIRELALQKDTTLHLRYVPSHVGVAGNEAADALTKEGLKQAPQTRIPFATAKAAAKRAIRGEMPPPRRDTLYYSGATDAPPRRPPLRVEGLTRLGDTEIRKLRTRRHRLVYDFDTSDGVPACTLCGQNSTVQHVFATCPHTTRLRSRLGVAGSPHNILLGQPGAALRYLVAAGLLPGKLEEYVRVTRGCRPAQTALHV